MAVFYTKSFKVTFVYEREEKTYTVVMDKYEFIHNVIKHIPDKNFKMVRYFGIHSRRAKKAVHIAMEKLGLLVKNFKPFFYSWFLPWSKKSLSNGENLI